MGGRRKIKPISRFWRHPLRRHFSLDQPVSQVLHARDRNRDRFLNLLPTVTIREGTLQVQDGHQGKADLRVTADSETWLGFLAKERSLLWALLRRKIRIKGSPKLLVAFGKCFPS